MKILGLTALLLSLLLLTVAPSSVLGAEFEEPLNNYPYTFSNINATEHSFNLNANNKVVCEGAELTGLLKLKSPQLVLTPKYKGCRYYEGTTHWAATIRTECEYEFIAAGSASPFAGKMSIIKKGCKVAISVPSVSCELYFEPQGPKGSVEYTVASSEMKWKLAVAGLKYTVSPNACPGIPVGSYSTGEYAANFKDEKMIVH